MRSGGQVDRAELPLPQRVLDASCEPVFLLFIAHFEPILQQNDAAGNHKLLNNGAEFQKPAVLFLSTEAHHMLDTRAVVPAAVKDNYFTRGGKVLHVTLHV